MPGHTLSCAGGGTRRPTRTLSRGFSQPWSSSPGPLGDGDDSSDLRVADIAATTGALQGTPNRVRGNGDQHTVGTKASFRHARTGSSRSVARCEDPVRELPPDEHRRPPGRRGGGPRSRARRAAFGQVARSLRGQGGLAPRRPRPCSPHRPTCENSFLSPGSSEFVATSAGVIPERFTCSGSAPASSRRVTRSRCPASWSRATRRGELPNPFTAARSAPWSVDQRPRSANQVALRGEVQGRELCVIPFVHVLARGDQSPDGGFVPIQGGVVQRPSPGAVPRSHLGFSHARDPWPPSGVRGDGAAAAGDVPAVDLPVPADLCHVVRDCLGVRELLRGSAGEGP